MAEKCPECVSGKHVNCTGQAWSDELDALVPCKCALYGHDEAAS